ncbi:MAG: ornithine carbamoyltransferase, partial [Actinobacteria bacterium]|nr:ornithine carbamoyltransferase [Actinomycetota bacterium]
MNKIKKDFLTLKDFEKSEIEHMLALAAGIKKTPQKYITALAGKNIALLFDKHSTRTRLS